MAERNTKKIFKELTWKENQLAREAIDIAFKIHKNLGPGLLESVYSKCFEYELTQRNIPFKSQQQDPIQYENYISSMV